MNYSFSQLLNPSSIAEQVGLTHFAVKKSANYLLKRIETNGRFEYEINLNSKIFVKQKYNILRHAGAIYALYSYYNLHPHKSMQVALKKAGEFLQNQALEPVVEQDNLWAIWSKPEINRTEKVIQAKLEGTGLGLIALLCLEDVCSDFTSLKTLQNLGNFIVFMQKEDGSFYSKFIPDQGGKQDDSKSLYCPGAAVLALLMLYPCDPQEIWLKSATNALEYLGNSCKEQVEIPVDNLAILAIEKLFLLKRELALDVDEELLVNYTAQICRIILKEQITKPLLPIYHGCFSQDGRIAPTAICLQALLGALTVLPQDHSIYQSVELAVHQGINFLLRAQIQESKFAGAFPRAISPILGTNTVAQEFNLRFTEVRLDYVQHPLSAMLQYLNFIGRLDDVEPETLTSEKQPESEATISQSSDQTSNKIEPTAITEKVVYLMRGLPSCGKSYTAAKLAGETGIVCETDEYFYTQVGNDPSQYNYSNSLLPKARRWNFERFKAAVDAQKSPIVVDRGNGLNLESQKYAKYAGNRGYKVELKEPESPWWQEIKVLLKYRQYTWPALEQWAHYLANVSQANHRVPVSDFLERMKHWQYDLTIEDIFNYQKD